MHPHAGRLFDPYMPADDPCDLAFLRVCFDAFDGLMTIRKLMAIDNNGYYVEHENGDSIQLAAVGIGGAPGSTGIGLAVGDLTLTGSAGIDISGSTGVIGGLPSNPSGATEATSKAYVDSLITGAKWRNPVVIMFYF